MAKALKMVELRNGIDEVYKRLMQEKAGTSVSNQEILSIIYSELKSEISDVGSALLEMSLIKIINDLSGRRRKASNAESGPNLFGEYPEIPDVISIGRGNKMITVDLPFGQIKQWLEKHPPKPARDPYKKFRLLIEKFQETSPSDAETLRSIVKRL